MNISFAFAPTPQKPDGQRSIKDTKDGGAGHPSFDDALSTRPNKRDAKANVADAGEKQPAWKTNEFGKRLDMNAALIADVGDSEPASDALPAEPEDETPDAGAADVPAAPADTPSAVTMLSSFLGGKSLETRVEQGQIADEMQDPAIKYAGAEDAQKVVLNQRGSGETVAAVMMDTPRVASLGGQTLAASGGQKASVVRLAAEQQDTAPAKAASSRSTVAEIRATGPVSATVTPEAVERPAPVAEKPQDANGKQAPVTLNATGSEKSSASAAMPDPLAGRVTVLSSVNAVAPAQIVPQPNVTASNLVSVIEGDPTWRAAAQDTAPVQRTPGPVHGVNSLRIQLNPAELGMVTARLTSVGSQLSIEIQVESRDAHQKLTTDSDLIIKSLRAVGFDVDKVTIQQTSANSSATQQGMGGRDQSASNQQAQGENSARQQEQRHTAGRQTEGDRHAPGEAAADRSGNDLYI